MATLIDEKEIAHLSDLSRIRLTKEEAAGLVKDLQNIIAHFDDLSSVDTEGVEPLAGGSFIRNSFRDDTPKGNPNRRAGVGQFPKREGDYLEVPKVFN